MQFLVTAFDYTDEGVQARRTSAREQHIAFSNQLIKRGQFFTINLAQSQIFRIKSLKYF